MRDVGMTLPQIEAHTFSLPVYAGENQVRISVLAGIREVQARVDVLEASLALCWAISDFPHYFSNGKRDFVTYLSNVVGIHYNILYWICSSYIKT